MKKNPQTINIKLDGVLDFLCRDDSFVNLTSHSGVICILLTRISSLGLDP